METHNTETRKAHTIKKDGEHVQIVVLPSAWENQFYVINEDVENKIFLNSLMTKEMIIERFGDFPFLNNIVLDEKTKWINPKTQTPANGDEIIFNCLHPSGIYSGTFSNYQGGVVYFTDDVHQHHCANWFDVIEWILFPENF